LITALRPVMSNKALATKSDFELAHRWPNPKAKRTAKAPAATPPRAKELGHVHGISNSASNYYDGHNSRSDT